MKKIINFKTIALLALLVVFSIACDSNEQDLEPIISTDDYPIATFVVSDPIVGEEGGATVTVDITFDKMLKRGVSFSGVVVGGTATEGEDFDIHGTIVQPFSTSAQLVIEIYDDAEIEDDETIEIQIDRPSLANKYLINPKSELPLVSITIENSVSDDLTITLPWSSLPAGLVDDCDDIDVDLYILDSGFNDVGHSWSSCPEEVTLPGTFDDGTYYIFSDLWSADSSENYTIPLSAIFTKTGLYSETWNQDPAAADIYTSDPDGFGENGGDSFRFIATIEKVGTVYTIYDQDDNELIQGKSSIIKAFKDQKLRFRNN